jgi:hypothetical protein
MNRDSRSIIEENGTKVDLLFSCSAIMPHSEFFVHKPFQLSHALQSWLVSTITMRFASLVVAVIAGVVGMPLLHQAKHSGR